MSNNTILTVLPLAVALISGCSGGDNVESVNPIDELPEVAVEDGSISELANNLIDSEVGELMDESGLPGLSLSIVSTRADTTVFWSRGYGVTNIENDISVDERTAFWTASMSKAVLGTLLQLAQEQGIVDLDVDIRMEIASESGFNIDQPLNREISLRDLATHTSGISDSDAYLCSYYVNSDDGAAEALVDALDIDVGLDCDVNSTASLRDFLAAYLDKDGQYYDPDDNFIAELDFEYSNIGSALAGHYLELRSGQSLHDYAASQLFIPMGMDNTGWTTQSLSNVEVATPHNIDEGDVSAYPNYELSTYPDGGLRSSAQDMAKFLSLIMNDGVFNGSQLLLPTSVEALRTPSEFDDEYGFFFELDDGVGHSGEDPGAASYMFYQPDLNVGVVVIANGDLEDLDSIENLIRLLIDTATEL